MRDIKFRFWDKKLNEFKYQDLEDLCEDDYWFDGVTSVWNALYDANTEQERFICNLYTGLKDKNGKEIYESDIVTAYKQIGLVVYRDAMFLIDWYKNGEFDYESYLYKCREVEIIGNIHHNPLELLAT